MAANPLQDKKKNVNLVEGLVYRLTGFTRIRLKQKDLIPQKVLRYK
jgi:hypothetical protein